MFPNVRLLTAAVIASVVALSCGFGLFAALRVNREPLARLPSVAAPLQLAASNAASLALSFASVQPDDRRLQTNETRGGADAAESHAATIDRRGDFELAASARDRPAAPTVAPEADAPAARELVSPTTPPTDATTAAADQSADVPVVASSVSAPNDQRVGAPAPEPRQESASAVASDASASIVEREPMDTEVRHDATPSEPTEIIVESASLSEPRIAESEVAADHAVLTEPASHKTKNVSASAKSRVTKVPYNGARKAAAKKNILRIRVAARTHHSRRPRGPVIVRSNSQDFTSLPLTFQTPPQAFQTQAEQWPTRRVLRTRSISRASATANSAIGGPFVSPSGR